jgi:hypothetical protein
MRRRDFIKVIVGSATAWPRAARAQQQTAKPLIGFLNSASPISYTPMMATFQDGLNQSGHFAAEFQCPLSGVKRTSCQLATMSIFGPNRNDVCCIEPSYTRS